MNSWNVVVAQSDCVIAEHLAATLHCYFRGVSVARDPDELRRTIVRTRANLVVADLDMLPLDTLRKLKKEFRDLTVICTHRIPDEEMWRDCLDAGAADCCTATDVNSIIYAVRCSKVASRAAAA